MRILRPTYLSRLIAHKHNRLIKIITGIRRCGKSFLLFDFFRKHLHEEGVDDDHIIGISLDDRKYKELRNPDKNLLRRDRLPSTGGKARRRQHGYLKSRNP